MPEKEFIPMLVTYKMQERIDTISARDNITDYMQGELGILNAFVDDVERIEKERKEMYELLEQADRLMPPGGRLETLWRALRDRINGEG